ncbi:MAG: class I SAM-dependent methyltransferase [Pseudoclavibacter sp.]
MSESRITGHDTDGTPQRGDGYAATAGAFDLFAAAYRPAQIAALEAFAPRMLPESGPILDVGAGSGANLDWILTNLPSAEVVALEPSPARRALALGRVAAHPEWFTRVTMRPEDFFSAPLPTAIGSALLMGVLGHFDPSERAAVVAELAARLPAGGAALLDLQEPKTPTRVEAFEFTAAQVGQLSYRGIAEAWPVDDERMRWRMTYLTLEGERVLTEDSTEHVYHHPSPETLANDADRVGMRLEPAGEPTFWLLRKPAEGSVAN